MNDSLVLTRVRWSLHLEWGLVSAAHGVWRMVGLVPLPPLFTLYVNGCVALDGTVEEPPCIIVSRSDRRVVNTSIMLTRPNFELFAKRRYINNSYLWRYALSC